MQNLLRFSEPEPIALDYENKELVMQALAKLTDRQRGAFLCWAVGFGLEETGAIMGITGQAVDGLLRKARCQFKNSLALS